MGLFDSIGNFLQNREGDFVKMEDSDDIFGPGPAVLLYKVPSNLLDEEVVDILSDGAPQATRKRITLARIAEDDDSLLDKSLGEALETVVNTAAAKSKSDELTTDAGLLSSGCPVVLFSGFSNPEMMASYNIIGEEIYQETSGQAMVACAKAVPNAMEKPLRQVLEEISGDHMDAIADDFSTSP